MADLPEAGERGRLELRDAAVEHLAERAALSVPGVVRHSSGLDRVTGRDLPRVEAEVSSGHARLAVEVAVAWPRPLAAVAAQVRQEVLDVVGRLTSLEVDRCDVTVVPVTTANDRRVA